MLKPALETHNVDGIFVAEFWDCFRLDPAPVQELRAAFEKHLANGGRPNAVVDLSGVGFAGSAALGNFVALHRVTRQRGGRLVLCNVDPTVREVLRASKLDVFFEFAGDRADAVRVIKETPPAPAPATDGDHQGAAPLSAPRERPALAPRSGPAPLRRRSRDPEGT
jgi:anti-anti-sigma factor